MTADAFLLTEFNAIDSSILDSDTKEPSDNIERDDEDRSKEMVDCNIEGIESDIFPAKVNGRTIRNAHLYNVVRKMINDCLRTCGLKAFIVRVRSSKEKL